MKEHYGNLEKEDFLETVIKENVLIQLANLRTHPAVAVRLRQGDLNLHGWVYSIESGEVWSYDADIDDFVDPHGVPDAV
jgi:carbonic anhydrase